MMDGIRFRTAIDQSSNNDVSHYTNIRLGINIGDFNRVTEPLYWLNPLSTYLNDLNEVKARPVFDPTDSDKDGVMDALDKEIQSPEGAPVDTRGVVLDSDGDGIPDYKDREPFSPPGIAVDEEGVAKITYTTMKEIQQAIDSVSASRAEVSDCGKWYLPMIHFDMDKSNIKPEFYGLLQHVLDVMTMCPDICITVQGHTDVRTSNEYNNLLSYDRAENIINYLVFTYNISRERFKLMYGGEDAPLIPNAKKKIEHYINRRVEIRVCGPNDNDMPRPPYVKRKKKSP
jgi:outer membrane protein OmpA-like peptidoglycan-associated protein